MHVRSILFIFWGTENELFALNKAFALAKTHAAYLRILHVTPDIPVFIEGLIENPALIATMEEGNNHRLNKAKEYSAHYAVLHNIPLDNGVIPLHHAAAKFIHQTGEIEDVVTKEGRVSDVILCGHSIGNSDAPYDSSIITSLFNTGKPVIVLPESRGVIPTEWQNKIFALAWNGSLESARALYHALPFLERAERVHILCSRRHKERYRIAEEKTLLDYMEAHGISYDITHIECGIHDTAEALLSKAVELESDILVMGAYGHTRFHEMILGGVTQYMLEHSTIPLLLSH